MATSSFLSNPTLNNEEAKRLAAVKFDETKIVKLPKNNPRKVSKEEFFKKVKY